MKEIKNIAEAKALVAKYRSITDEDIEHLKPENFCSLDFPDIIEILTGFGSFSSCTLCQPCQTVEMLDCSLCIHSLGSIERFPYCVYGHSTYKRIGEARTITELLEAFKNRADYIESLINIYESKTN